MTGKWTTFRGVILAAPFALLTACAQQDKPIGPPVPAPLSAQQAAEVAQDHVGGAGDARLSYLDDVDNGQMFGVTTHSGGGRGGAMRESRILFVHDDGSVVEWPGRTR